MRAWILGAGAQGRVILDILRAQAKYESVEFLDDDPALRGQLINSAPVLGNLEKALALADRFESELIVAVGRAPARMALAAKARAQGITLLNAVHPTAVIMPSASIGTGNMIAAGAVINTNASVGDDVILNTAAVIEHDCRLEDGSAVSPGCQVGGRVRLERGAFLGTGAIVLARLTIGAGAIVAAGSVVTHDVPPGTLVMGAPARVREPVGDDFDWSRVL